LLSTASPGEDEFMHQSIPALLDIVLGHASSWFEALAERPVRAGTSSEQLWRALGGPLPENGAPPTEVIAALADAGVTGTIASAGPRYFGFVIGGSMPAALAADWLVSTWDQNACTFAHSPLASTIEQITGSWIRELAGLPATMSFGFVTGGHMANFTALACARHSVLRKSGWDVEADGLNGAPPIEIFVNEESHYTILLALRLLGLGSGRVRKIPADEQGRMRPDRLGAALRESSGPCIVCAQAGNVNTGAFDPLPAIADATKERGAWLHVDGAFGQWAAASPEYRHLVRGIERADSLASDAHKWLNVPYDCGLIFCADEAAHRSAMSLAAVYIGATGGERDPHEFVPEESRRARAIPVYAALRSLGRSGLAEMIERNCRQARRFGEALHAAGFEVLNDVVLNQVLVSFGAPEQTQATMAALQQEGTCWCGGTVWKGRAAMRISVSNWATSDEDVERSIEAMIRCARSVAG
jgi:glutamate/tyrosine decarboxylase-like PLP-dependent enzyme